MQRKTALIFAVPLTILVALAGYEAYAVSRAKARTPEALARTAHRELPLASLPSRRIAMLLAVEDPSFYAHRGVDFRTPGQGMTTITQALVKRLYFDRFKPGFAKIEQSLIAWLVLDKAVEKRDQLEIFVNYAYLGNTKGHQVFGFGNAARAYFGRGLDELDDRRFLSLVAMLMGPNALDPIRHTAENAERVRRIEAMLKRQCRPRGLKDVTYEDCA